MEGLVHDSEHIGFHALKIDVVAESARERLDRDGRVVAGAIEAPVDRCLGFLVFKNLACGSSSQRNGGVD